MRPHPLPAFDQETDVHFKRNTALSVALALFAGLGAPTSATAAASYPTRTINMIVPFSAGGGADNAARIIVQQLGKELGQSIIIKNVDGASGAIGEEQVARADKDGYTVLFDASSFVINPLLRKMPFDVNKDFIPVSLAVSVPNVMVVNGKSPYTTLQSFIDAAKKAPGKLTFASYGQGSIAQLIGELLKKDAGIDMLHIPYKGGAPAVIAVMGGEVDTFFANAASSISSVRSGKLRALAVTSTKRMTELPDVPTVEESGFKDFNVLQWNGFFLPSGTPPDVVLTLQNAVQKTLKDEHVKTQLGKLGLDAVGNTSVEFKSFVEDETQRWSTLFKTNPIKMD
jgi:tripartite-type tricarboxylate transporter receptor subunit TctC